MATTLSNVMSWSKGERISHAAGPHVQSLRDDNVLVAGLMQHDRLRISCDVRDLRRPDVNVVHLPRAVPAELSAAAQHHCIIHQNAPRRLLASLPVEHPELAAEALVQHLQHSGLQQAIHDDACTIAQALGDALQRSTVTAKLELIEQQSCPRFHADRVGIRCLCTYAGPGTEFVANRHVRRTWDLLHGHSAVEHADEAHAQHAAPWDLLYLKGHMFPNMQGMGAVHRSPPGASEESPRLLLTVDDSYACSCCGV